MKKMFGAAVAALAVVALNGCEKKEVESDWIDPPVVAEKSDWIDPPPVSEAGGYITTCVKGVTYIQFTPGTTVMVDREGKPVPCD